MSQDSQQPQHSFLSCSAAILLDSIVDFGDAQIVSIKVLASASIAVQEQIDNWFSHLSFSSTSLLLSSPRVNKQSKQSHLMKILQSSAILKLVHTPF